ncbi:MAG: serine/threonine protein kinase [Gracilibacter sp. BRH_c7a]|nr:MAG: serine/threonine protein kinase [Gracilibacter sp. BRH_c7a]
MGRMYGGRYEIEEKIGAGGMAIVYKARDTLLNRTVAIKVLREQFVSDEGFIRRFRREAQSAASLSHHNIVSIYDVGKDGEADYIVMEYVKGYTLKEIIRKQAPFSPERAIYIVRQIAEALAHAHANNIIHRDIKPQNILVTMDGRAKVTDFGIARAASSATLTHTGDIVGSVHYLSPEQAKGAQTNEQSDIYSLGIILFELITGKVPYDGDTPITIALKHIQEEAQVPSTVLTGISTELDGVIMKALAKSVQDRYKSADEFLNDLDRIQSGQTVIWNRAKLDDPGSETQIHKGLRQKVNELNSDNKEDTLHKKNKKKIPLVAVLAIITIILVGGTAAALWNMYYVPEVAVPDLKGLTIEQARIKLENNSLILGENIEYAFSEDNDDKDKVINQSYSPDTLVKAGREIEVTLSRGMEVMVFPDVTTTHPLAENAVNIIKAAGFEGEINIKTMLHPTILENRVISQSPAPSAMWPKTSNIELYVSGGEELSMAVMPDVIGMPSEEAKISLEAYKLVVRAETQMSFLFPIDAVISTVPAPGKPVKQGSEILMIISEGPGPPP